MKPLDYRLPLALLGALASAIAAHAQTTPPPAAPPPAEDAEAVVLSPFTVTSTQDRGYQATSTLAGTRLRTNVGDLATSIQIVTKQFMEDTGANNARELLVYTTGTEVAGPGGNFSNTTRNNEGVTLERGNFLTEGTRVRGLAGADRTRDYFGTSIPFDSYNSQSVEINRGANSALFGLGSPAGIINNSLALAERRTFGSVAVSGGSFGSYRGTLDFNVAPGDRQFAVRVAGLYDHDEFEQKPAYATERRGYAAFNYEPAFLKNKGLLSGVTLRGNFEQGRRDSSMPRTIPVLESISRWISLGKPMWDPTVNDLATTNRDIFSHNFTFTLVSFWPDPASGVPTLGSVGIPNVPVAQRPISAANAQTIFAAFAGVTRLQSYLVRVNGDPFIAEPQLANLDVLNQRHHMVDGPNKSEFMDFDVTNAALEARFLDNKAGIEFAYNRENFRNGAFDMFNNGGGFDAQVHIDINTKLLNGAPNPNFGRPYLAARGVVNNNRAERDTRRATGYYNFNFEDVVAPRWGRWLGKHTLTLMASESETKNLGVAGWSYLPGADLTRYQTQGVNYSDINSGPASMLIYLGPSVANAQSLADYRLQPVTAELRPDLQTAPNNRYVVFNPVTRAYETQSMTVIRQDPANIQFANGATRTRSLVDSQVAVLQSTILHETVVATTSWRADQFKSYSSGALRRGSLGQVLYDETNLPLGAAPGVDSEEKTFAYGAVARLGRLLPRRWAESLRPAVFYNRSENFQPSGVRVEPFGTPLSPPTGTTKDYGAMISLMDGKLDFRATWFETKQAGVGSNVVSAVGQMAVLEARVLSRIRQGIRAQDIQNLSPGITQAEVDRQVALWQAAPWSQTSRFGINPGSVPPGAEIQATTPPGTTDTATLLSKGVEIEGIYNPTPQWRIAFNVAKQEAVQANIGSTTLAFINERLSLYQQAPNLPTTPTFSQNVATDSRTVLATYYRATALEGTLQPEVREWRANVVSNYRFSRGPLKGVGLGGAYRWEDQAAVGYQTFFDPALGIWRIDPTKPWFAPAEDKVDAWVSYERRLFRRFDWKLQLNVRNVLDDDALMPTSRNPDGSFGVVRIPEGRRWELTSRFSF